MSYARFSATSDVYVYEHVGGFIECCGCGLTEPDEYEDFGFFHAKTPREMLIHLDEHKKIGDQVPERCYAAIITEYEDLDKEIEPYVTPPEVVERRRKKLREMMGEPNGETN